MDEGTLEMDDAYVPANYAPALELPSFEDLEAEELEYDADTE